ncbi:hypothetical protein PLEOSDRAFT_1103701 [Pleurotus ostreatus PC15]|uniref:Uncharacterized protein n=1 Tax=Pleurotus ostreatus (strain PC15) TaxID=1137138 RepID=A0A067NP11_PLEO1|nr:hypothetical protein PLEOSDRAFT_1103701 [Pleurotus ostreatus PC15]
MAATLTIPTVRWSYYTSYESRGAQGSHGRNGLEQLTSVLVTERHWKRSNLVLNYSGLVHRSIDGALPSPSCLFALKHEGDDGQNAISNEEEMDTTPRTSKRRIVKQVVVSSDDESEDILESHRLGNRFIGSPGNEPPITPMMKGCLETPTSRRYPKRARKQVSRYAEQKSSQDDEGSEGDDESLSHCTPLKRRKTVVSGRAH